MMKKSDEERVTYTANTPPDRQLDDLARRVRHEYLEMPGLRLTLDQAQRLWQLGRPDCEVLLRTLVDSGFLARTTAGAFVRAGSGRAGA